MVNLILKYSFSLFSFDIETVIQIQSLKEDHVRSGLKKLEKAETRVILFYASE